jgi:hypothetical protein
LLDPSTRNVSDITLALIEFFNLAGVGVETDHAVPSFGKAQPQRQTYVTASDDSDLELRALEKFRLSLDRHGEYEFPIRLAVNLQRDA